MAPKPWTYYAVVVKIVDADTSDVEIDLGFYTKREERLRLARIDAWEVRGEERPKGLVAKDRVIELIPVGSQVIITTEKKGKYGRYIAEVIFKAGEEDANLSDLLVEEGHAEYADF